MYLPSGYYLYSASPSPPPLRQKPKAVDQVVLDRAGELAFWTATQKETGPMPPFLVPYQASWTSSPTASLPKPTPPRPPASGLCFASRLVPAEDRPFFPGDRLGVLLLLPPPLPAPATASPTASGGSGGDDGGAAARSRPLVRGTSSRDE